MDSVAVFFSVLIAGYFILPMLISKGTLHLFLWHATLTEATWRDRALKFLTDRLNFVAPNAVSISGFLLVLVLVYLFWINASVLLIFIVAMLAGFSDMLDGSLARNNNRVTSSGVALDVARDVLLAIVPSYFLIISGVLRYDLFWWFFIGWVFLGAIRFFELKITGSNLLKPKEDYKSALDRARITLYILGILALILVPKYGALQRPAEILIIVSIIFSAISILLHSAHLRILREEINGGVVQW